MGKDIMGESSLNKIKRVVKEEVKKQLVDARKDLETRVLKKINKGNIPGRYPNI